MPKINLNSRINSTSFEALAANFLNQSVKTNADVIHRNLEITNNAVINGNLTVKGSYFIIEGQETEIKDNIIVLNAQDIGQEGITLGYAGIQLYRGPNRHPFYLIFDEQDDKLKGGIGPDPTHNFDLVSLHAASTLNNGLSIYNHSSNRFEVRDRLDINLQIYEGLTFISPIDSDIYGTFNVTGTSHLNFNWKMRADTFILSNSQAIYEMKTSNSTGGNLIINYNNPSINNFLHLSCESHDSVDGPLITSSGLKIHGRGTYDSEVNEHIFFGFDPTNNNYSIKVNKSDSLLSVYRPLFIGVGTVDNVIEVKPLPSLNIIMNAPVHITNDTNASNYYTSNNVSSFKCAGGGQFERDVYIRGQLYVGSGLNVPLYYHPSDYSISLSNGVNIEPSTQVINSRSQIGNGLISSWITLGVYCSVSNQMTSIDFQVPLSNYTFSIPFEADIFCQISTESTQIFNVVCKSIVGTKRIQIQFNSANNIDCHYIKIYCISPYAL